MRYSDRPIIKPSQDVLGRSSFALQLARSVDGLDAARDGFVIAIIGEWGSGKTSVVELIVRHLRHIEMERASAYLSRWGSQVAKSAAELEQMCEVFERIEPKLIELDGLGKNLSYWQRCSQARTFEQWLGSKELGSVASDYWHIKLEAEANPKTVVVRFSPWLIAGRAELAQALISELARSLGKQLGDEVKQAFSNVLVRLSEFAPIAGAGLDAMSGSGFGKLVSSGAKWSEKLASKLSSGPTLDDLRQQLRAVLLGLVNQRVMVVVDDLDRLTPNEALEMVALVKSLGDLPNIIYLLTYDEGKLAELIGSAAAINGREFLEKIVQYPVHLPTLNDEELVGLLNADIDAVFGDLSLRNASRLNGAWPLVFRHYLRTPRSIRRLVNAVSVAHSGLLNHVDPVDLLLLELLRLYEPGVYSWLRRNIDALTE